MRVTFVMGRKCSLLLLKERPQPRRGVGVQNMAREYLPRSSSARGAGDGLLRLQACLFWRTLPHGARLPYSARACKAARTGRCLGSVIVALWMLRGMPCPFFYLLVRNRLWAPVRCKVRATMGAGACELQVPHDAAPAAQLDARCVPSALCAPISDAPVVVMPNT